MDFDRTNRMPNDPIPLVQEQKATCFPSSVEVDNLQPSPAIFKEEKRVKNFHRLNATGPFNLLWINRINSINIFLKNLLFSLAKC